LTEREFWKVHLKYTYEKLGHYVGLPYIELTFN